VVENSLVWLTGVPLQLSEAGCSGYLPAGAPSLPAPVVVSLIAYLEYNTENFKHNI